MIAWNPGVKATRASFLRRNNQWLAAHTDRQWWVNPNVAGSDATNRGSVGGTLGAEAAEDRLLEAGAITQKEHDYLRGAQ